MDTISSNDYQNVVVCADEINKYLRDKGYINQFSSRQETFVEHCYEFNRKYGIYPFTFKFDALANCKLQNKPSAISVIGYQYRNMSPNMLIRMCYYMYEHINPFLVKYNVKDEMVNFGFEEINTFFTLDYLKKEPTFCAGQLILDKNR